MAKAKTSYNYTAMQHARDLVDEARAKREERDRPKSRVEVLTDEAIINGHELRAGTVIELPDDEIDNHRSHGVALGAVRDDDDREVFDVSAPREESDG